MHCRFFNYFIYFFIIRLLKGPEKFQSICSTFPHRLMTESSTVTTMMITTMTQTAAVYTVVGVTTVQRGTGEGESTQMVVTKVVSMTTTGTMTGGNVAGAQKEI